MAALWLAGSTHGFATRVVGGNARAARLVGLPALWRQRLLGKPVTGRGARAAGDAK